MGSKPQRIQRKRVKGWKMPRGAVNVTRPGKWGNPFRVVKKLDGHWWVVFECDDHPDYPAKCFKRKEDAVKSSVEQYRDCMKTHQWYKMMAGLAKIELRGKDLACWCPENSPCHASVLLEIANAQRKEKP